MALEDLINKLSPKDKINISLGVRPSGQIHLGNIVTLLTAAEVAYLLGNQRSQVMLTICDIDFPDKIDVPVKGNVVTHYKYAPDPKGDCHKNFSEHNSERIYQLADDIAKELGTKIILKNLSDIQNEPGYREGLVKLLDHSKEIADLFPEDITSDQALIFPLCKNCHTANKKTPTYKKNGDKVTIYTSCENPGCDIKEYEVDVLDTSYELAVHFFIDPIRDSVIEPKADLHIFGGDYADLHGKNKMTKSDKVLKIMGFTCKETPIIFTGPVFYAQDGKKMSKSSMSGLTYENLKEYFGNDYIKHLREFNLYVLREGYSHVDFSVVREKLLVDKCIAIQQSS